MEGATAHQIGPAGSGGLGHRLVAIAGGIVAFAALWIGVGEAQAGQYTVYSCRGPDGAPISTEAWRTRVSDAQPGDIAIGDDCAAGGSLRIAVTDAGVPPERKPRGEAFFDLPPGESIAGYEIWRSIAAAANFPGPGGHYIYAAAIRESGGGATYDSGCASALAPPSYDCSTAGDPGDPLAAENLARRSPFISAPLDGLGVWAGCLSLGCEAPLQPPAAEFRLFRAAVSIEDDAAPTVEALRGSLAEGGPVSGMGHLFVAASDRGGGVASFSLSIDGGPARRLAVGGPGSACREPYSRPDPCPEDAGQAFDVDTTALALGPHTASGEVVDAAGNTSAFGPLRFSVARPSVARPSTRPEGGPPAGPRASGPDNGSPAVRSPVLRLRTAGLRHRFGKPAWLRGHLRTAAGTPIAGALLRVSARDVTRPGAKPRRLPPVRTGADGGFAVRVRGAGARRVRISYAPVLGGAPTRTAIATVTARLKVSLAERPRRARRGRPVTFTGRLRGAGPAARGANVEIQAVVRGRWRTVATVRAGRAGRFRWVYRFRYVERDALFSFRAVVPHTPGWPWRATKSARLRVFVDGAPRR